jgi:BirA family biotin operon repressor/biotin-[acetyl-CoA-carboxylase] ligase
VHEYVEVPSTNLIAAALPAWSVVRSDTQTGGRGRFNRAWMSDPGGLWLSAVVPLPEENSGRHLPLLVGLAVCEGLGTLGARFLRMRWPNDVLVGHRKLAGLLVDQVVPGLAIAGIGINVANQPEKYDPLLKGQVARLAEWISPAPPLERVQAAVLSALEDVLSQAAEKGMETLLSRINPLWQAPRTVQLDLPEEVVWGEFEGVDATGRLSLRCSGGQRRFFEAHQVRLLRDLI